MANQIESADNRKNPNFLLIVILAGIAIIIFCVCAVFLVGEKGKKLLPGLHHDPQPTSSIAPVASRAIDS
jgi:hypothetical protein